MSLSRTPVQESSLMGQFLIFCREQHPTSGIFQATLFSIEYVRVRVFMSACLYNAIPSRLHAHYRVLLRVLSCVWCCSGHPRMHETMAPPVIFLQLSGHAEIALHGGILTFSVRE